MEFWVRFLMWFFEVVFVREWLREILFFLWIINEEEFNFLKIRNDELF